jgi:hypothetical protein
MSSFSDRTIGVDAIYAEKQFNDLWAFKGIFYSC